MCVHPAAADDVAARRREDDLSAPGKQRTGEQNRRAYFLAERRIELGGAQRARVDLQGIACRPFGGGADGLDQFDQRLDVADARHVLEVHRLLAQQRGGDDGQSGILVARRADASGKASSTLDDILHGLHV